MKINIDHLTDAELIELNHKIVERFRIMHQVRAHKEMFEFKIGDRVTFHPSGHGKQIGTLTRFNKKTVTVITDNGGHWNVAPSLVELSESDEAERTTEQPQLKLMK